MANLPLKHKITLIFTLAVCLLHAQKFENIALTIPIGWNSWSTFKYEGVNEIVIKETADAMVSKGLKAVGYEYIVIDDCWEAPTISSRHKFRAGMLLSLN